MGATGTVMLRELRCACHRLLMKISSTSSYRLEAKCPRCSKLSTYASTGGV